jgi:hypothetical protein
MDAISAHNETDNVYWVMAGRRSEARHEVRLHKFPVCRSSQPRVTRSLHKTGYQRKILRAERRQGIELCEPECQCIHSGVGWAMEQVQLTSQSEAVDRITKLLTDQLDEDVKARRRELEELRRTEPKVVLISP